MATTSTFENIFRNIQIPNPAPSQSVRLRPIRPGEIGRSLVEDALQRPRDTQPPPVSTQNWPSPTEDPWQEEEEKDFYEPAKRQINVNW